MERNNLCKILNVPVTATKAECKIVFHKLAHVHHPDKVGGNEEMFKKINEAYQTLMKLPEYIVPRPFQSGDGGFSIHMTYTSSQASSSMEGMSWRDMYAKQNQQNNADAMKARQDAVADFVNQAYQDLMRKHSHG